MTEGSVKRIVPMLLILVTILTLLSATAAAEEPGSGIAMDENQVSVDSANSLQPIVTETGKISLSLDGLGTNAISGTIEVEKPAGATVRKAYMAAASMGTSSGYIIPNGGITIDGAGVTWDASKTIPANLLWSPSCYNHWADVTSMIKSKIDSAAPGRVSFTVAEDNPIQIDGVILAVIFDDPSQTTDNTVILLYGAQNVAGDTFAITLAEPVDKTDPNLKMDFSLGISYGAQAASLSTPQYSLVEVNSNRLTTSAGGSDDGIELFNGQLITVGGLDDTNSNPPDPNAIGWSNPRYDDELYNILPFVNNGDTSITVYTQNPSTDDNIFFAALNMKSAVAIVGEGIVLSPLSATNPVGSQHTVTAAVKDDSGQAVVGRLVTFNVVSGPHAGQTDTDTTDSNGEATFTYTGTSAGTDTITASFVDSQQETITSNEASKIWVTVENEGSIDIEKYVWNGTAWVDADTVPGPSISCEHAKFRIVVTNTGDVPLVGITVTDTKKGKISLKTTTLAPGASTEVTYTMKKVCGQQVNTATASGIYSSKRYTDTDKAYYYGKK